MRIHVLAFARSGTKLPAVRQTARNASCTASSARLRSRKHAQGEPEGDASVTVVELRQRVLVRARDERHERLVGKVCVLPARSHGVSRPGRAAQR